MALLEYIDTPSPIHRVDPRTRLLVCLPLIVLIALAQNLQMLAAVTGAALVTALILRIPLPVLRRRLLLVNTFLLLIWASVPLAMRGPVGAEAIVLALRATFKANAIMLLVTCLVSTIEIVTLGHAFAHLRMPQKLVHLFLFTVRYTEVLHLEYERLARAMKTRAFRPALNRATYRALAALAGMLLVRSLDRADRVIAAMKCRGFRGQFYLLHHFHFHRRDGLFGLAGALILLMLAYWEWT